MTTFQAIITAVVEGLTEFLPISSTAHMIFVNTAMGIQEDEFVKLFTVSIQFGAILAVVALYWKTFFNFRNPAFYLKLAAAVIPALVLGKLFDDAIEAVLEKPMPIAVVLILGGVVLLFIDKLFPQPVPGAPTQLITDEKEISVKKAVTIGFWQCLAMMPGTSRAAASIIGGMQQRLTRAAAAEFSFFLAVPTMLAVTAYSILLKDWHVGGVETKGYKLITQDSAHLFHFLLGNVVAFIVAALAIRFFIGFLKKYGFQVWGWYRIVAGGIILALLMSGQLG
ncbi:MAG: undecaprenyl-diphosphate phosphatase [Sphingobacteriales bacterium]|nr:MAG: undecaprenyl-diphosphate phosphatase [Sphingobacteriales bacterium]